MIISQQLNVTINVREKGDELWAFHFRASSGIYMSEAPTPKVCFRRAWQVFCNHFEEFEKLKLSLIYEGHKKAKHWKKKQ